MIKIPNSPGFWKHIDTQDILDVYELEPVNNTLCIWCEDVGITYTDHSPNQIWTTDEWRGHIPVDYHVQLNYPNDTIGWIKI